MITIDQKIAEWLNNWQINGWPIGNFFLCLIALVLSIILCGIVGLEREKRGRNAGLRTHLLVGVGSCIIMIISIYGFPQIFGEKRDVARLAAQIVTGVGFLGAGAIIHLQSGVKGLTTAATIWIVMAIGVACGSFNFVLAVLGTVLIIVVLTLFRKIESRINKRNVTIILVVPADKPVIEKIHNISKQYRCTIHGLSSDLITDGGVNLVQLYFNVNFEDKEGKINEYVDALRKDTEATSVNLLSH